MQSFPNPPTAATAAAAAARAELHPPCGECGAPASATCTRCRAVVYCGKECQRAAWPRHKAGCAAAAAVFAAQRASASGAPDVAAALPPNGTRIVLTSRGISGMDPDNVVASECDARDLREKIQMLQRIAAAGKKFDTGRVLAQLRAADVRALSEFRGASRAAREAWAALLDDLAIYRAARAAFDNEPVPFVLASDMEAAGGSQGGIVDKPVAGGYTIKSAERGVTHLAPPAGATLRFNAATATVEAVWPDGRATNFAQIRSPGDVE